VPVITVADRESDGFEFIPQAEEARALFRLRARPDRRLVPEASAGYTGLRNALASAPVLGALTGDLPGTGNRRARTASVAVRVAPVTIQAPPRRGAAKAAASREPVSVNGIAATAASPPQGTAAIRWVRIPHVPVSHWAAAAETIEWDGRRGGSRSGTRC
jgi:hypothetical protein